MVCGPVSEGVTPKATIAAEGMGVGDRSMTREKVSKLVSGCNWGERPVRDQTSGVLGMNSVGSGGRLSESEQEIDPLRPSRSANKGEVLGESFARFVIRRNEGMCRTNK